MKLPLMTVIVPQDMLLQEFGMSLIVQVMQHHIHRP
jgi:hypothetical protein